MPHSVTAARAPDLPGQCPYSASSSLLRRRSQTHPIGVTVPESWEAPSRVLSPPQTSYPKLVSATHTGLAARALQPAPLLTLLAPSSHDHPPNVARMALRDAGPMLPSAPAKSATHHPSEPKPAMMTAAAPTSCAPPAATAVAAPAAAPGVETTEAPAILSPLSNSGAPSVASPSSARKPRATSTGSSNLKSPEDRRRNALEDLKAQVKVRAKTSPRTDQAHSPTPRHPGALPGWLALVNSRDLCTARHVALTLMKGGAFRSEQASPLSSTNNNGSRPEQLWYNTIQALSHTDGWVDVSSVSATTGRQPEGSSPDLFSPVLTRPISLQPHCDDTSAACAGVGA